MAAQAAVAAVRKGCEMLSEGKAEISKLKSTVEKGIGDAKAIYTEVTGLWGWIKNLLSPSKSSASKAKATQQETNVAKAEPTNVVPKKREQRVELSYEEYQTQAIHQVCEQLKTFFEIRRKLKEHCHELEEISLTTETVEDSAIDRVQIELQLENMTVQIREAMVYAPMELRNIYSRFLAMYDQILEEQEFARQVKKKQERDEAARQWQRRDKQIELVVQVVATVLLLLMVAGIMLDLKLQVSARYNFWHVY